MFCPRCGTENDDGNRFCVNCGAPLAADPKTRSEVSFRDRVARIIGSSREARIVTVATAALIVVAVVAFIVLKPTSGDSVPQDAYLRGLDHTCLGEKARISSLEKETLGEGQSNIELFSSLLVRIVTEWHANLRASSPPPLHAAGVHQVESALIGVLIEAGTLDRLAREGDSPSQIAKQTEAVNEATEKVDPALEELGLERCLGSVVGPS